MAQLTVYVDEQTRKKSETAAKDANLSVSQMTPGYGFSLSRPGEDRRCNPTCPAARRSAAQPGAIAIASAGQR